MRNKSKWHSILLIGLVVLLASSMVACGEQVPPSSSTIGFSPSSLSFSADEGGANPASQTLTIWNSGEGTLSWWLSDSATWLTLSPTSGASAGETDSITAMVDIYGMDAGNYAATITISALGAANDPQTMAVNLAITPGPKQALFSDSVAGLYVNEDYPGSYMQLNSDGTFLMPLGFRGTWQIDGDELTFITPLGLDTARIEGNKIITSGGNIYVKKGAD
jgi:hypothetical protein